MKALEMHKSCMLYSVRLLLLRTCYSLVPCLACSRLPPLRTTVPSRVSTAVRNCVRRHSLRHSCLSFPGVQCLRIYVRGRPSLRHLATYVWTYWTFFTRVDKTLRRLKKKLQWWPDLATQYLAKQSDNQQVSYMDEKLITTAIKPCDYLKTAGQRIFDGFYGSGLRLLSIISITGVTHFGRFLLPQSSVNT